MFYVVYVTLRVACGEKRTFFSKLEMLQSYVYFCYQCHESYYREMLEILDSHDEDHKGGARM